MNPKISIIIPCKEIDSYTEKCVGECLKQDYDNFEIYVLPDERDRTKESKIKNKKVKIIATGCVKPSIKRNLGMAKSVADFYGFIDSDAYPIKGWLSNSMKYFKKKEIGIVGGPNLTPPEGNFWEHVSGHVLSNFFASGAADIRYKIAKTRYTHELPSCNYITRREAACEYNSCFLTAEDSEFCFACVERGYRVLYAGDVVVFHHRRDSLGKHLKQMFIYGRDIVWLLKERFSIWQAYYSIMSIFVIGFFVFLIGSFFSSVIRVLFIVGLIAYGLVMFLTSIYENLGVTIWTTIATVLTHFAYGFGFLKGLFWRNPMLEGGEGVR